MKTNFPQIKLKTTADYAKEMSPSKGMGYMGTVLKAAQQSSSLDKMMKEVGNALSGVLAKGNKNNGKEKVDSKSD